ncbi:C4-dicarboxylate ABC transporter [Kaistella sp.]|uniref:C4-dicarboxylate ABC transporter n=1 Tax=Kaistella sp. TaxID=2782235 RepID=UPI002F95963A
MLFNWLSLVTGLFYIVLGIVVIIYKFFIIFLEPNIAYALGALLILYGIFRIVRAIYRIRQNKNEE